MPFSGCEIRFLTVLSVDVGGIGIHYGFVRAAPDVYHHCDIKPTISSNICDSQSSFRLRSNSGVSVTWALDGAWDLDGKNILGSTKVKVTPDGQVTHMSTGKYTFRATARDGCSDETTITVGSFNDGNTPCGSLMSTYVHQTTTTAIDFTCRNDKGAAMGFKQAADINKNGIFYTPVDDNAKIFSDLSIQQGVSQNLLVYTAANGNDIDNNTEAYDIADNALGYKENTSETTIYGHHIFKNNADDGYTTSLLHLVERTPEDKNSEGDKCENNDFCAPIQFTVTNHAWYVRKPMYYAEDATGAWEGICLPFTAQKVMASLNGEITHFYGTPTEEELDNPATNTHKFCIFRFVCIGKKSYLCRVFVTFAKTDISLLRVRKFRYIR